MIDSYNILSYEERLKRLHLTTMGTRRLRGDLIEVFKILKGFKNVYYNDFLTIGTDNRRSNILKLFKERFSTNLGKFSFVNRIRPIDEWNLLCENCICWHSGCIQK